MSTKVWTVVWLALAALCLTAAFATLFAENFRG